jgi:hypothetical protein
METKGIIDTKTYGAIMETLGGIRSDIRSLDKKFDEANRKNDERFEKLEDRVCVLEQKPGKRWETVIASIITLGIGYAAGVLLK